MHSVGPLCGNNIHVCTEYQHQNCFEQLLVGLCLSRATTPEPALSSVSSWALWWGMRLRFVWQIIRGWRCRNDGLHLRKWIVSGSRICLGWNLVSRLLVRHVSNPTSYLSSSAILLYRIFLKHAADNIKVKSNWTRVFYSNFLPCFPLFVMGLASAVTYRPMQNVTSLIHLYYFSSGKQCGWVDIFGSSGRFIISWGVLRT